MSVRAEVRVRARTTDKFRVGATSLKMVDIMHHTAGASDLYVYYK